eukprot:COSAG02_NODE_8802_length_2439_cov_1.494444_1_plen_196_part_00
MTIIVIPPPCVHAMPPRELLNVCRADHSSGWCCPHKRRMPQESNTDAPCRRHTTCARGHRPHQKLGTPHQTRASELSCASIRHKPRTHPASQCAHGGCGCHRAVISRKYPQKCARNTQNYLCNPPAAPPSSGWAGPITAVLAFLPNGNEDADDAWPEEGLPHGGVDERHRGRHAVLAAARYRTGGALHYYGTTGA